VSSEPTPEFRDSKKPRQVKHLGMPRAQRLRGKILIDEVFKQGKRRRHHPLMACQVRREDHAASRLAISIGRRCGSAVGRNAIRRRIREAYRLMQHDMPPGLDILLVVRPHQKLKVEEYGERLRMLLI
jgi:ribonuclease P protein component